MQTILLLLLIAIARSGSFPTEKSDFAEYEIWKNAANPQPYTMDEYLEGVNRIVSDKEPNTKKLVEQKTMTSAEYKHAMKKYNYGKMMKHGITYHYKPKSYLDLPRNYIRYNAIISSEDENVLPGNTSPLESNTDVPIAAVTEVTKNEFVVHLIEPDIFLKVPTLSIDGDNPTVQFSDIVIMDQQQVPETDYPSLSVLDPVLSQIKLLGQMEAHRSNLPLLSANTQIRISDDLLLKANNDGQQNSGFSSDSHLVKTKVLLKEENTERENLFAELPVTEVVNEYDQASSDEKVSKLPSPKSQFVETNVLRNRPKRSLSIFNFGGNSNSKLFDGQPSGQLPPHSDYIPEYGIKNSTVDPISKRIRMNQFLSSMGDTEESIAPQFIFPMAAGKINLTIPTLPPLIAPSDFAKLFTIPPIEEWFLSSENSTKPHTRMQNITGSNMQYSNIESKLNIPNLPYLLNFSLPLLNNVNADSSKDIFRDMQDKFTNSNGNLQQISEMINKNSKDKSFLNFFESIVGDMKTAQTDSTVELFSSSITTPNPFSWPILPKFESQTANVIQSTPANRIQIMNNRPNLNVKSAGSSLQNSSIPQGIFNFPLIVNASKNKFPSLGSIWDQSKVNENANTNNDDNISDNLDSNGLESGINDFFHRSGLAMIKSPAADKRNTNTVVNTLPRGYLPPVSDSENSLSDDSQSSSVFSLFTAKEGQQVTNSFASPTTEAPIDHWNKFLNFFKPKTNEGLEPSTTSFGLIPQASISSFSNSNRRSDSNIRLPLSDNGGRAKSINGVTIEEGKPVFVLSADDKDISPKTDFELLLSNIVNKNTADFSKSDNSIGDIFNQVDNSKELGTDFESNSEKRNEILAPFGKLAMNIPPGIIERFMASSNIPNGLVENVLRSMRSADFGNGNSNQYNQAPIEFPTLFTPAPFTFPTFPPIINIPQTTVPPLFRYDAEKTAFPSILFPTLPPFTFPTTSQPNILPTLFPPISQNKSDDDFTNFLQEQARNMSKFFGQMAEFMLWPASGMQGPSWTLSAPQHLAPFTL